MRDPFTRKERAYERKLAVCHSSRCSLMPQWMMIVVRFDGLTEWRIVWSHGLCCVSPRWRFPEPLASLGVYLRWFQDQWLHAPGCSRPSYYLSDVLKGMQDWKIHHRNCPPPRYATDWCVCLTNALYYYCGKYMKGRRRKRKASQDQITINEE